MPLSQHPNIEILQIAADKLGPLVEEVVFLGGCATNLLVTDPAAPPPRATRDVDVIVEVVSLSEYHRFSEKLRDIGFREDDSPEAPICRWKLGPLLLDVMPTDPNILGFGNRWFAEAFKAAETALLPRGTRIKILPAAYFLATKFEAFDHRGANDYVLSRDIEDLVAVIDGREEIVSEVLGANDDLRFYLCERVEELLSDPGFLDALPGFLPPDTASQARSHVVVERFKKLAAACGDD